MEDIRTLLIKAKEKDEASMNYFIEKYFRLAIFLGKKVFINGFTEDDIKQVGIMSILIAIDKYDINKFNEENDIFRLTSYVYFSIRNNYNFLIKNNIKSNGHIDYISFSNLFDNEIIQVETDPKEGAFGLVFMEEDIKTLKEAIKTLNIDEIKIIDYLYLKNINNDKHRTAIEYSRINNMNTRRCYRIKHRALKKLNRYFKEKDYLN